MAALGLGSLYLYTQVSAYGVDRSGAVWGGFGDLMIFVMIGVLLILGIPATVIEVWALGRGAKGLWLARLAVIGYLAVGGWWAFLPGGLRFFGDTSPVRVEYLTLGVACYLIIAATQGIGAYLACRWRVRSRYGRAVETTGSWSIWSRTCRSDQQGLQGPARFRHCEKAGSNVTLWLRN